MAHRSAQTLEKLRNTPGLGSKIEAILSAHFVNTQEISQILASAIYSSQNVILYGPGGHGKSEMVEAALEGLGLWDRKDPHNSSTLIQSFGEGLTEDILWGGLDMRALNSPTHPEMVFNVDESFLAYPVAVFEELFDAPPFCLLPLKHTLQAGFLGKNGKNHPMATKLIIACTNRNPEDIAAMGETYSALLERFVLRQEVLWENYNAAAYEQLLKKHKRMRISPADRSILAGLMAECQSSGHTISPRTAMKACDVLVGAAVSQGRQTVDTSDFAALKFVTGFQHMAIRFEQTLVARKAEAEAQEKLNAMQTKLGSLITAYKSGGVTKVMEFMVASNHFGQMAAAIGNVPVTDSLYEARTRMINEATELSAQAQAAAVKLLRVEPIV